MTVWKKGRRVWGMVCLLLVLAAGLALPAGADVGPKPSVEVVFRGLEGRRYYATLLGNVAQYGPWSAEEEYLDWKGDPEAWEAFAAYPVPEGWYFLGNYADCTETGRFVWSYYPPETFYILVWLPEEGRCLRSTQPVSRYAFDSHFTVMAAGESLTVRSSYDYAGEVQGLLARAALTILIETAAGGLLFGLRRRDQLVLILRVNLVTQLVLNLLLNLCAYFAGPMLAGLAYVPLELAVFAAEGCVYAGACPGPKAKNRIPGFTAWGPTGYRLPPAGCWQTGCPACSEALTRNL